MNLRHFLLLVVVLIAPRADAAIDRPAALETFDKAAVAYASGEFKEAAALYEQLLASGHYSSNLYYNLGNTWFRLDEPGRAALNYQRAILLDPQSAEARTNLDFVRNSKGLEPAAAPLLSFSPLQCGVNQLFVITTVVFWVAIFSISAWVLWRNRWTGGMSLASVVALAGLVWLSLGCRDTIANDRLAVVLSHDVPVRLAPADSAGTLTKLPAASTVNIESVRGTWVFASLPDGRKGWVPSGSVERVAKSG